MPETEESINSELNTLKLKRGLVKGQLTRFKTFLSNINEDSDTSETETRLKSIESNVLNNFNDIQEQIELIEGDVQEAERENFENSYYKVITDAKNKIFKFTTSNNEKTIHNYDSIHDHSNQTNIQSHVKLPQLHLPEFHGRYDQWITFYDTFKSLINDNPRLNEIEKFYYLKSCVKDEAAQIIHSIEVSSANYAIAFEMLKERYENKKLIVHTHVKAIFDLYSVKNESYVYLRKLLDNFNKHLRALTALGQPTENWDTLLIHLLTCKLDPTTKREYEETVSKIESPKLTDLTEFLSKRCQLLETIENKGKPQRNSNYSNDKALACVSTEKIRCAFCSGTHFNYKCEKFLKMPIANRLLEVKRHKLCRNCLRPGHQKINCKSGSCRHCGAKHNSALHEDETKVKPVDTNQLETNEQTNTNKTVSSQIVTCHQTAQPISQQILLATAKIYLQDATGTLVECRALLDSGSMSNFITHEISKKLKLKHQRVSIPIAGINNCNGNISKVIEADISSIDKKYQNAGRFLVVDKITSLIPTTSIELSKVHVPNGICLADSDFHKAEPVQVLLGASIFFEILCIGQIKLGPNKPIWQKTRLGWVISGPYSNDCNSQETLCNLSISNENLHKQIERFWSLEEVNDSPKFTTEETDCEQHFLNTYKRDENGRFEVSLPFRENSNELGDSEQTAITRFERLEKRLQKDLKLKDDYRNFLSDYERLGHMTEINLTNDNIIGKYYLPHHGVVKLDSTTTKLRVVFDASAKTTSGLSLNDVLKVGPLIQRDLTSIILSFRMHNVVLTADVEKMYRQVNIVEEHRDYQRILWRNEPCDTLKHYRLNTVTYGTAPASFLAVRALHQAAIDNKSIYPQASKIIKEDFYMDDLISGAATVEEGVKMKGQIEDILHRAGFPLRKFRSNRIELLEIDGIDNTQNYVISDDGNMKTLGLYWDPKTDSLHYSVNVDMQQVVTKRTVLSTMSKIFDPLGLISPIVVKVKLLLQQLWQARIEWDESLPMYLDTSWRLFRDQLIGINNILVPRQVTVQNADSIELHGFSDASERAYGACIYIRTTDAEGNHFSKLLSARSRVSPLKVISLPRLELCGALLLAKFMSKVEESIKIKCRRRHFWCDSTIVLNWLAAEPVTWKTFVANRVAEIQERTTKEEWKYVSSELNPADVVSRGTTPRQLLESELWWHGPEFLLKDAEHWPASSFNPLTFSSDIPERRKVVQSVLISCDDSFPFEKFSNLTKLQRVTAFMLRFVCNARRRRELRIMGDLTCDELKGALEALVRICQSSSFSVEMNCLAQSNSIPKSSKLLSLNPFIDSEGLLRVGGRIKNSIEPYQRKHPILLPSNHKLTTLIIEYEHIRYLHAGPQLVLSAVRNKFWPISGKNTVKGVIHKCIKCFKTRPRSIFPKMGNLPKERLVPTRPFTSVGIDFAGPLYTKASVTRTQKLVKSYVCLFICFVTKAVHIELVGDLSTETFLNALKRFVARRGLCRNIYSDNGTNFVGAQRELRKVYSWLKMKIKEQEIRDFLLKNEITWNFIPPRAPHFGGLWESNIKCIKTHLLKVVGNAHLTYELLSTILCQIEGILNSRPLTQLSSDPNDFSTLTPAHFLIGDSIMALPERNPDITIPQNRLKMYERLQCIVRHFWRRWSSEYLTSLQQRKKWNTESTQSPQIGSLVLLKEDDLPVSQWRLGRIAEVHPGSDNIVRVVSVKTAGGVYKRSVTKVCILPID